MKRFCISFFFVFLSFGLFAQAPSFESVGSRLSFSLTFNNDFWQNVPDSISPRGINQGVDIYALYRFPMDRKERISFFIGAGIGVHNFYHNALMGVDTVAKQSYFYPAPSKVDGVSMDVKKSKLALTYFDIPFGFMLKSKQKYHATLGFKVGWTLNETWKYKGTNYHPSDNFLKTGEQIKQKYSKLQYVSNMHYGPFLTLGYKWFGVTAFYQITSVFEDGAGPDLRPISVGITFKP